MNLPASHNYAAYARDSGGDHQELSTDQQRQAIERWAAQNDCTITMWFTDAARPGRSNAGGAMIGGRAGVCAAGRGEKNTVFSFSLIQ